jgi:hypothetical protein
MGMPMVGDATRPLAACYGYPSGLRLMTIDGDSCCRIERMFPTVRSTDTPPRSSLVGEQLSMFDLVPTIPIRPLMPNPRSLAWDEEEGGCFEYERCPDIFLGRLGRGPLRVAWDTNILVDYACFGGAMWDDDEPFDPLVEDEAYRENLIAFQALMELWSVRDIRIHVFDRQLTDAKRQLTAERASARMRQVEEITAALYCVRQDTDRWEPAVDEAMPAPSSLSWMEPGADRELLEAVIDAGCHVFLTRDHGVLRNAGALEAYWLVALCPADLLDRLAAGGEFGFTSSGAFLIPDSHKWTHLMAACDFQ